MQLRAMQSMLILPVYWIKYLDGKLAPELRLHEYWGAVRRLKVPREPMDGWSAASGSGTS